MPLQGDTRLVLDAHKPVEVSSQPLFFRWTADIDAAYRRPLDLAAQGSGETRDIGSVRILAFRDPDVNGLMVGQRKA